MTSPYIEELRNIIENAPSENLEIFENMKIQIASDLHLEMMLDDFFQKEFVNSLVPSGERPDILVLAGDVVTVSCLNLLSEFCDKWSHVVFVPGNHFYYGSSIQSGNEKLQAFEQSHSNFCWLRPGVIKTINEQRFLGGNLWFERNQDSTSFLRQRLISDFTQISDICAAFDEFEVTKNFILANAKPDDIVVTHHLPHFNSVSPMYKTSTLNCFFVSDLSEVINKTQPSYWIHGHTHQGCDYFLFNENPTRVICNPAGYYQGENRVWNPYFTIEI